MKRHIIIFVIALAVWLGVSSLDIILAMLRPPALTMIGIAAGVVIVLVLTTATLCAMHSSMVSRAEEAAERNREQ